MCPQMITAHQHHNILESQNRSIKFKAIGSFTSQRTSLPSCFSGIIVKKSQRREGKGRVGAKKRKWGKWGTGCPENLEQRCILWMYLYQKP